MWPAFSKTPFTVLGLQPAAFAAPQRNIKIIAREEPERVSFSLSVINNSTNQYYMVTGWNALLDVAVQPCQSAINNWCKPITIKQSCALKFVRFTLGREGIGQFTLIIS